MQASKMSTCALLVLLGTPSSFAAKAYPSGGWPKLHGSILNGPALQLTPQLTLFRVPASISMQTQQRCAMNQTTPWYRHLCRAAYYRRGTVRMISLLSKKIS
jgi:hypothetical protein